MRKRNLAVVLMSSLGLAVAVDLSLVLSLALEHRAYIIPLASVSAFIPGFVVAALAWQGRLPSSCKPSH
jgi:hypothetical protein